MSTHVRSSILIIVRQGHSERYEKRFKRTLLEMINYFREEKLFQAKNHFKENLVSGESICINPIFYYLCCLKLIKNVYRMCCVIWICSLWLMLEAKDEYQHAKSWCAALTSFNRMNNCLLWKTQEPKSLRNAREPNSSEITIILLDWHQSTKYI